MLQVGDFLPATCGVSSVQFLLRSDDGALVSRNWLPIKRVERLVGPDCRIK
jgi:hypothetical protein